MQKNKNPEQEEPGRTPGSAEGEEEPGNTDTSGEPGRTPGSAEGEDETAENNLEK